MKVVKSFAVLAIPVAGQLVFAGKIVFNMIDITKDVIDMITSFRAGNYFQFGEDIGNMLSIISTNSLFIEE